MIDWFFFTAHQTFANYFKPEIVGRILELREGEKEEEFTEI